VFTKVLTVCLALAALAAVAGCTDRKENEARLFLGRAELISIDAPIAERRQLLERLEALPLTDETVVAVRGKCVGGHGALIEAEEAQNEATIALGSITGGDNAAHVPAADAARIEAMITRSSEAIVRSRALLVECEDGKQRLRRSIDGRS